MEVKPGFAPPFVLIELSTGTLLRLEMSATVGHRKYELDECEGLPNKGVSMSTTGDGALAASPPSLDED